MVTISLVLLSLGVIGGLMFAGIWAYKTAQNLTPSDIV